MDWVPAQEEGMPALHYACMNESTEPAEMLGMGVSFASRKRFACKLHAVSAPWVARERVAAWPPFASEYRTLRLFLVITALLMHGADPKAR